MFAITVPATFSRRTTRSPARRCRRSASHGASRRAEERRFTRNPAPPFWVPPGDTDYFATVTIPKLYYERLDEAGIDFSVLYPTVSFGLMHNDDDAARRGLCHWFNEWTAEQYRPFADRMTVAGLIPMHTPDEAIAELEHIRRIGLKVGCIASYVARPVPQFADASPEIRHRIRLHRRVRHRQPARLRPVLAAGGRSQDAARVPLAVDGLFRSGIEQ